MKPENIKAQMRKGILELCILKLLDNKERYPAEIITSLKASELIVVEGTLYPLLNRLKRAGVLDYRWEESDSGPPRKYYTVTEFGKHFVNELEKTWSALQKAVQQSENPK